MFPRKQFVVFIAGLLLFAGQLTTIVHATEHPFHMQGDLCASFIHFWQQDMSVDIAIPTIEFNLFSVEVCAESKPLVHSTFRPVYSPRAPPAF